MDEFNVAIAFDNIENYKAFELFETNEHLKTVVTELYDNVNISDNILTIERNADTPLSAFIVNYLQPNADNLDGYLTQIKNKAIQDICRMDFTVNNKPIKYDQTGFTHEQNEGISSGRCNANVQKVIDVTFDKCYEQLFGITIHDSKIDITIQDSKNGITIQDSNLNDLYAVLVLSSQSAFAKLAIMIATLNTEDIIGSEDMFHLRNRNSETIQSSYTVNVTSNEAELYVVNNFYGEIYQVKDTVPVPYANVHAIITANIKPSPNVSFTIEIIPIRERAKKIAENNRNKKLNNLTGVQKEERKKAKAYEVLGHETKQNLFGRMFRKGGKYTKRERKPKCKSRTRKKTRRRSNLQRK